MSIDWSSSRWDGVVRPYSQEEVKRLSGTANIKYTLAEDGSNKLWDKLNNLPYVSALGALTGNQALQQAKAGLDAVYLSGWQVAADANSSDEMYPDQSLYNTESVPNVIKKINNTFIRADQIQTMEGTGDTDYFLPIVADAESGFGGVLNTHELFKHMIREGAAGIHLEDQLSSAKKCGHMGGKVLVPTSEMVQKLIAARLAADTMGVPTVIIARTDSLAGNLITSDHDDIDKKFITGERTAEGFYRTNAGMEQAIARGLAYAPYCDLIWMETGNPDIGEANTDYLDTLLDEASEGAGIIYVDLNGWTNPNNETHAITFREPRARNLASVSINNFKISSHIDNPAPVGLIKINGAYDNNSMFNVNAVFGGDDHPVIEVTKGIAEGTLGQSVNWTGVNAIGATGGNRTAPTIKINWLQEGTFNSCKAFGSPYRVDGEGDPLYSANPCWEIDNSRGLVWIGSSAALTLGSGFLFKATERSCQYHTMVGCTYELIGRVESTLFLSNVSIYTEGGGLLETPQASAFNVGQLVKFGQAATQ